ncbi:hypothetical protein [Streptomyces zaomyceticus]|uniref:hypothetical protein n=1 Tax=Streptomyces zaomyceticus TaxID=68286 RepID=UPI001671AA62|nr:hypothetical protein [Streptomyces zaomyceticus]GHG32220.1 hypothetical protein GCM10018791_56410 [Streptomyces zaomyceticus]
MSPGVQRVVGAVGTVAVAALVNIATGWFTDGAVVWWVSGGVLLVVGIAVQWWLTPSRGDEDPVSASGEGAVATGGSARDVEIEVTHRGGWLPRLMARRGVSASGRGSLAARQDVDGARTKVTDQGP